jgi:hypothetical protein
VTVGDKTLDENDQTPEMTLAGGERSSRTLAGPLLGDRLWNQTEHAFVLLRAWAPSYPGQRLQHVCYELIWAVLWKTGSEAGGRSAVSRSCRRESQARNPKADRSPALFAGDLGGLGFENRD